MSSASSRGKTICAVALLAIAFGVGASRPGRAQEPAQPAAASAAGESSQLTSTSTYDDVMNFLKTIAAASPKLVHLTTMGTSTEGRPMPLVVVGEGLADGSAASVRASGKVRVWIQASSYRGEADGKGAALTFLSDLATGKSWTWLPTLVFLVNPIFDADGNERLALGKSAPSQGTNAVDLSRDFMLLKSPEASALVKMLLDYDPQVSIDLHTSQDACSAYSVTYAAPVNPNTSERILGVMKDEWLPFVTTNLKTRRSIDAFYHGSVEGGDNGCQEPAGVASAPAGRKTAGAPPAAGAAGRGRAAGARGRANGPATPPPPVELPSWTSGEHLPSVEQNYIGLRNRFALVGESHPYATSNDRLKATSYFLEEALSFVYSAAARLKKACVDADAELVVGKTLATTARPFAAGKIDILMGGVELVPGAGTSGLVRRRTEVSTPVQMRDRLWYEPTSDGVAAAEYFIPAELTEVANLLKKHGIQVRELPQATRGVEQFTISGIEDRRLTGSWRAAEPSTTIPAKSWVVRMNQPLARLVFYLIEPTSDDGLAKSGLLDESLKDAKVYPISRRR